jgi:hypothetical protein
MDGALAIKDPSTPDLQVRLRLVALPVPCPN